jgi:hypothetical protein
VSRISLVLLGILAIATIAETPILTSTQIPCYERNIQPYIAQRCLKCHMGREHNLETYDQVKSSAYAIYREVMSGNKSMMASMTGPERKMFEEWYHAGARRCSVTKGSASLQR